MKKIITPYLPRKYSNLAIIGFTVLLLICIVFYIKNALPVIWIAFAFAEVIGFFYFANILTRVWYNIPEKAFMNRLFATGFILRLFWVVSAYFFFEYQTGIPFEFDAGDSRFYHDIASITAKEGLDKINDVMGEVGIPDRGFPVYLSIIYTFFDDYVIIPRIINAILSAWTCLLVYKLGSRNFGEKTGRIAGILTMLAPMMIYFTGLHLKETVMIFILMVFMERADLVLRDKRIKISDLIILTLLGGSLFFFRTVLFFSVLFAVFSTILLSSRGSSFFIKRMVIGIWILVVLWMFFSAQIKGELDYLTGNIDIQETNLQWRAVREGGNRLATYGSSLLFAPFMLIAPFPTLVNIETQQEIMMLSGAYFIKNILAFFVITALIIIIKNREYRKYMFILSFLLIYLAILTKSSFSLSGRFHLPLFPFYMILAAYGITNIHSFGKKYYIPYILLIALIIIGWNWFKLAGRGII